MDADSVYTISEWAELLLQARGMPVKNPVGQLQGFDLCICVHGREHPVTELAVTKLDFDMAKANQLRTYLLENNWPKPRLYVAHTEDGRGRMDAPWCVMVGNTLATKENLTAMLQSLAGLLADYKS